MTTSSSSTSKVITSDLTSTVQTTSAKKPEQTKKPGLDEGDSDQQTSEEKKKTIVKVVGFTIGGILALLLACLMTYLVITLYRRSHRGHPLQHFYNHDLKRNGHALPNGNVKLQRTGKANGHVMKQQNGSALTEIATVRCDNTKTNGSLPTGHDQNHLSEKYRSDEVISAL